MSILGAEPERHRDLTSNQKVSDRRRAPPARRFSRVILQKSVSTQVDRCRRAIDRDRRHHSETNTEDRAAFPGLHRLTWIEPRCGSKTMSKTAARW